MNYELLVNQQRAFFNTGKTKSIEFRIEQLKKLEAVLLKNESLLYSAIYSDFKKSEFDTYTTELILIYKDIKVAIDNTREWAETKRVKSNFFNLPSDNYIIPEPLGVSLIIGAWNYPFQLTLSPFVAAISAGNTVIIKPSELASHSAKAIAEIINNNFPPEYLKVIEGGPSEMTEVLKQKFDKLFFTGSTRVGKIIYEAAAKHLTPVTLELGGKSPAFVTENCDMKITAKRLVWGKFLNAGQTCIAPDYVLVHASVKQKFLEAIVKEIVKCKYAIENNNYVQIINDKNFARLVALLDKSKICYGGKSDSNTRYIEPTVLDNISFDDPIMQEEIFGPLLPIISYTDINDVILQLQSKPKPLSCYVFTNDPKIKDKILRSLSFGGGCINDTIIHVSNHHLPFGGVGDSGTGSYHGEAGFRAFSHYKSILDKALWFETSVKYSPYSKRKLNWIKKLTR